MDYKRALVTGGAGFIGSHLVERLLQEGLQVVVLDNLSVGKRENVPRDAEFVLGDVRDLAMVSKALSGVDAVFHLAARVSIRASVAGFYEDAETNLMGTLNALRACASAGIKKFIYASSMAVYADSAEPVPLPETYPTVPISPYGVAKLASERYTMLVAAQSGFQAVALRYFNTYGPRQTFTPYVGVITIFVQRLLRGEPPMIFGDGEQCRDFVYVGDVVEATYRALVSPVDGEVFNVGSGVGTSVNQIAALLCARLGHGIEPQHVPAHPGELRNSVADISKAQRLLGYEPRARLADKIDEIIAWNREVI
ncbi:MAG: NAD-dependent epimerase/dehydratase family protein [Chloroflexi bacterium]|nr:NAD-dependent epimerase/dehydratase family protein [Chloroflexota bacterium]